MKFMKFTGFTDSEFEMPVKNVEGVMLRPYSFMINPDAIKQQRTFEPAGATTGKPINTLNFDAVIDCTGIVDPKRTDLPAEMSRIEAIVFQYNGAIHQPNFVHIQWGDNLNFYGLIASYDIAYTLFKPDGTPLRAKIAFVFNQCAPPVLRTNVIL